MSGLLIAAAVLAAVGVSAYRAWRARAAERRRPGASAESAIAIDDFADIDAAVLAERCRCGGRFVVRGEGTTGDATRPVRRSLLECRRCERQRHLYFDLSRVRH